MTGIFEPSSCYCCMRMLAEQETSSAAASATGTKNRDHLRRGHRGQYSDPGDRGGGGALLAIGAGQDASAQDAEKIPRQVDEEMGRGAKMPGNSQAGRKS